MDTKNNENVEPNTPPRKYEWRYGPLRLVLPWVAVAVGIIMAVTQTGGLDKSGKDNTSSLFFSGLGLIVLGIIAFFVYRQMAKRGI